MDIIMWIVIPVGIMVLCVIAVLCKSASVVSLYSDEDQS